jgi:exopolysaccharide biosynthesis protein
MEKKMKKKFNGKLITKIVIADILVFAVSILTFAYFDHVRGWGDDTPVPDFSNPFFDLSNGNTSNSGLFNPGNSTISQEPDNSEDTTSADDNSQDDKPASPSPFTDGEVIFEENVYKSPYVSIEVKEITYNNKLYMVQDIYIKRIECLGAGFAKGLSPLSGEKSTIFQMVEHYRNNGYNIIGAVNGDYCGYNSKGATIRNGVLYGKGIAQFDVCVVYKDGTMVTMAPEDFNAQTEIDKGAWQVWDFGPNLLDDNGKALSDFSHRRDINGTNPRTAIGYYEPGHYCFVVAGGRGQKAYGVKLSELSAFMESIGCKTAYNLDGGRSSIMVYGEKIVNEPYQDVTRRNTDMVFIQDFLN